MLPPVVYAIFGTCRSLSDAARSRCRGIHASVGTGGLVSLLTGEVLADQGDLDERTEKVAILTALVGP